MEEEEKLEALSRDIEAITAILSKAHEYTRNWIGPIGPRLEACSLIEDAMRRVRALDGRPVAVRPIVETRRSGMPLGGGDR